MGAGAGAAVAACKNGGAELRFGRTDPGRGFLAGVDRREAYEQRRRAWRVAKARGILAKIIHLPEINNRPKFGFQRSCHPGQYTYLDDVSGFVSLL